MTVHGESDLPQWVEAKVTKMTLDLRNEFVREVPLLSSSDIAKRLNEHESKFVEILDGWRKNRRVVYVEHEGKLLYPAFQFGDDGLPLPIVHELLCILSKDEDRTCWDDALWFAGDTGWLDGATPMSCLIADPEGVRRAAEQEVLPD